MLPYLGSGAGQGFEDVYALCYLLGDVRSRKCHLDVNTLIPLIASFSQSFRTPSKLTILFE